MQVYGVDSKIGILASLIMGSTETTIYVISVYGSKLKNRNMKPALILGLIGDFICVVSAIVFYNLFF
jgi:spore maturation protein B